MMRRRTTCTYCGVRIDGAAPRGDHPPGYPVRKRLRRGYRVACDRHYRLVAYDPAYGGDGCGALWSAL